MIELLIIYVTFPLILSGLFTPQSPSQEVSGMRGPNCTKFGKDIETIPVVAS